MGFFKPKVAASLKRLSLLSLFILTGIYLNQSLPQLTQASPVVDNSIPNITIPPAQVSSTPFAYVANRFSNNVSVINTSTNAVTATVAVGSLPNGVAITPDGTAVYVTNFSGNSVSVISTATNTVIATIPVGTGPNRPAVTPDGSKVYVPNGTSGTVSVISTATNTVTATVPGVGDARDAAITPDGAKAYLAKANGNSISVVNTATNTVTATIDVGGYSLGIAMTPNGNFAYVSVRVGSNGVVAAVDTNSASPTFNTVVATIQVGALSGGNISSVAVTPDGSRVYVVNNNSNAVHVINTANNTLLTTLSGVGGDPQAVAITPDGNKAYVTSPFNTVRIKDTNPASPTYHTEIGSITLGSGAYGIAIASVPTGLANTPWPMFHYDLQHTGRSPYAGPSAPALKWSYATGASIYSSPAIGADGAIYVGSEDNKLYALNPNGALKWTYATGGLVQSSPAIGADGAIYVGSYDGKLYALNTNGTLRWTYATGSHIDWSSPAIGADGTIYVGSNDTKLYALNPNGTLRWTYATGGLVQSSPAIGADGAIYVGSYDGKLYAINSDGTLKWKYATEDGINSSPAIGADGTLYVASITSRKLYAFEQDTTPPTAPTGLNKISPDNNPLPAFKWVAATDVGSGVASYEVQMDSGAWTNIGNKLTYVQPTVLSKASHTFAVRGKDAAGNVGPASASLSFTVSVTADLANTKIAITYNDEIYRMNIDFTGKVNLTNTPGREYYPAWSPDGSKIAFMSNRDGDWQIYVMNADGMGQTRLTTNNAVDWGPTWSPDGTKIAFHSNRDGNNEIYVMNANGTGQNRLTNNNAADVVPSWSPDGTKIAFESNRDGKSEIYVMNADGSGQTKLTTSPAGYFAPKWSPNGNKIAFFSERADGQDLYIINSDGTGLTLLTPSSPEEYMLWSWSPDGSKIISNYEESVAASWKMAILNVDGTGKIVDPALTGQGSWSPFLADTVPPTQPSGLTKISSDNNPLPAFKWNASTDTGAINPGVASYEVQVDTGAWVNIGNNLTYVQPTVLSKAAHTFGVRAKDAAGNTGTGTSLSFSVSVTADLANTKIAFASNRDGNLEIYVMNADGSQQVRLTQNIADDVTPQWAPDGTKIAFSSNRDGNWEIYVMNVDGSQQARITTNSAADTRPVFSPDGSKIVFTSTRDGNQEIYVMNSDGSGLTRLTTYEFPDIYPAWSPDASKIAFNSESGNFYIYVMNADGSGKTKLTNSPDNFWPDWSPVGNSIAFQDFRNGNYEIYVMNADGSGQTRLTFNSAHNEKPAWSPDGSRIAFTSTRDGNQEIYVMDADGSPQTRLTNNTGYDDSPAWSPFLADTTPPTAPTGLSKISPDNNPLPAFKWVAATDAGSGVASYEVQMDSGSWTNIGNKFTYVQPTVLSKATHTFAVRAKDAVGNTGAAASLSFNVSVTADLANTKIAFHSNRDGNYEVYVMNADGSSQTRLTNNPAYDGDPAWSPDGSRITFQSNRDGNYEIYVMNADGSGQARLTTNPAHDSWPAWSPDGSKIAFRSNRDGNFEIYVMNADGSGQTRLTNNPALDEGPAWSPDGSKIAFTSSRDGNPEIYVMNADGSGQARLTTNPANNSWPVWSPDGSKIAFFSQRDGNWEIYVMNTDGSGETRLTINTNDDWTPTWSPDGSKIAFTSKRDGNWEIYVMNAEGSSQTRLTSNPADDFESVWSPFLADTTPPTAPTGLSKISPDNNPLPAFKWVAATDTGSGVASYEVQMDSGAWVNIGNKLTFVQPTVLSKASHTFAVRAKDGAGNTGTAASLSFTVSVTVDLVNTKVAFSSNRDGNSEIYVMSADGTGQSRLTNTPGFNNYAPAWSPDGTRIAFNSNRAGNNEIYVMNSDGSGQTNLTHNQSLDDNPVWSPDGTKIAFHSTRNGNYEIYMMNADGSNPINVTNSQTYDANPEWLPDGGSVAFISIRDGSQGIYVMNADGSSQTKLHSGPSDLTLAWSPDGTQIAFWSGNDSNGEIYVMDANGTNQVRLTNNLTSDNSPKWSPDGTKVIFTATRDGNSEIYVMNAGGAGQVRLTNNNVSDGEADWSPLLTPEQMAAPIVSQARQAMAAVTSFHFVLSQTGGGTPLMTGIETTGAEGDAVPPDLQALVSATIAGSPFNVQIAFLNGVNWVKNPITGYWQEWTESAGFLGSFNPGTAIDTLLSQATGLQIIGVETVDGVDTNRVRGNVAASVLATLTGGVNAASGQVQVDMWIGQSDSRLRKVVTQGKVTSAEVEGIVRTFTLSAFNQPVTLVTPLTTPTGLSKISPDNNPLPAFKWSAVSVATAYEVQVDTGAWTNIGNKLTYVQPTVLSKGAHTFAVRGKDGAGNAGPAASLSFNVSVVADLANTRIAFQSNRDWGGNNYDIYLMNADGSGQTRFSFSAKDGSLNWSPDGSKMVFNSNKDGNAEIYVMNADGTGQTRLTFNSADDYSGDWSPDGSRIAFVSGRDGNTEIYVMNSDGSAQTRLTNNPATDRNPTWSPDGSKIAFASNRNGNYEIYVMSADGTGQTNITNNPSLDLDPRWSPTGAKITFRSGRAGPQDDIYVMDADGSNPTNLTANQAADEFPAWSPDGSKIAFFTNRGGWEVYVMNADGSGQTNLTNNAANDSYPSWSPFLVSGPPAPTNLSKTTPDNDNTPTFTWGAVTDAVSYEVKIDSGAYANIGNVLTYTHATSLTDSSHTFSVRAKDSTGVSGNVASLGLTIDTTPPGVPGTPTMNPASPTNNPKPTFTWTAAIDATLGVHHYEVRIDPWINYTNIGNTTTYTPATDMPDRSDTSVPYTIFVRAIDAAGNTGSHQSLDFRIDTNAPTAPNGLTKISPDNNPLPAFKWNAATDTATYAGGGVASYEVQVDSGVWTNIGNKLTYVQPTVLTKASHTFAVRAKDVAGNAGPSGNLSFNVGVEPNLANTKIAIGYYGIINIDGSTFSSDTFTLPSWSPAGDKVAYMVGTDLYVKILGSGQTLKLDSTTTMTPGWRPAWSPDGTKIAYVSNYALSGENNYEINVINSDGSGKMRLTNNTGRDLAPTWSPDGTKIAFLSEQGGARQIYIMNPDGSNQGQLSNTAGIYWEGNDPVWAPDGVKIVFAAGNAVYVVNTDGSGTSQITSNDIFVNYPYWSPDSTKIVYVARKNAETTIMAIFIINADGTNKTRLSLLDGLVGWSFAPAWSPFLQPIPAAPTGLSKTTPDNDSTPSFTWNAVSGAASYEVSLDGAPYTNMSNVPAYNQLTPLTDGGHTFKVRAKGSDSVAGYEASLAFSIDTTPPTSTSPALTTSANNNKPGFSWSATTDAVSGIDHYEIQLDGGAWSNIGNVITYTYTTALSDGSHTFGLRAADKAANTGATASLSFIIDTNAPNAPANLIAISVGTTLSFAWSAVAGADHYEARFDSGSYVNIGNVTTYTTISTLPDGPHTFYVRALDGAGNISPAASLNFVSDATPPTLPTNLAKTTPDNNKYPSFSWTAASDATTGIASYKARFDSATFSDIGKVTGYSATNSLSDGSHTFQVKAVDVVGNEGAAASLNFIIDTTPPTDVSPGTAVTPTSNNKPTFTWPASVDAGSGIDRYEVKMDSGTWSNVGNITSYTPASSLSDGSHTINLRAVDKAGNVGNAQSANFVVDTTPPTMPTGLAKTTPDNDYTPTFAWNASLDTTSGIDYYLVRVDANAFASIGNVTTFTQPTDLVQGAHTFEVKAVDKAGNTGSAASIAVNLGPVVNQPPVAVISSPTNGVTYLTTENISFNGSQSSDPNGDPLTYEWFSSMDGAIGGTQIFTAKLRAGNHEITLKVSDNKGASSTIKVNIVVNTPPIAIISSPVSGATYTTANLISFDANLSSDPDGDPITVEWWSNLSGLLGTTKTMSKALTTTGNHTIQLKVFDGRGGQATTQVTITVIVPNQSPTAIITSPTNGAIYTTTDTISFNGSQSSDPDGDTITYEWTSNLDSVLGTTATLSKKLSAGSHTISLKVSDGKGGQNTVSVNVTVNLAQRDVKWNSHNIPTSIKPGQMVGVTINLTNTGSLTWLQNAGNQVYVTYHWYNSNWQPVEWGTGLRSSFTTNVANGQTVSITASLKAPSTPGTYNLFWDVVHEGVAWFSGQGASLLTVSNITVAASQQQDVQWVSQGTPTTIKPGEMVGVPLTLTNTGSLTWAANAGNQVYITYHWYNSNWQPVEWGTGLRSSFTSDVTAGQMVSLTASLKAPSTVGSYNLIWDMVQEGVAWYSGAGAPVLGVSGITVAATQTKDLQWVSQSTPTSIKPGQMVGVPITLTNTGSLTWPNNGANPVYVTYHWYNSSWQPVEWGIGLRSSFASDVPSGQMVSLTASLKAPSTAGSYNLIWDVVHESVAWYSGLGAPILGVSGISVVASQAKDVQWVSHNTPTILTANQQVNVSVTLTNTGSQTWSKGGANPVKISYHWLNASTGAVVVWNGLWSSLPLDIAPGQMVTLTASLQVPLSAGSYNLMWDMVQEGVGWFSGTGVPVLGVSGVTVNP